MVTTAWKLINVSAHRTSGATLAGELEFEFFDTTSSAPHTVVRARFGGAFLAFSPLNSWILGKFPSSSIHLGQLVARNAPFALSALVGQWGAVLAHEGTSGSLLTVCFSTSPPPAPTFLTGMIAYASMVQRASPALAGMLETSVIPFRTA